MDINTKTTSVLCVVYFDHKIPDERSFPEAITKGEIKKKLKITRSSVNLLPSTHPPYKTLKYIEAEEQKEHDLQSTSTSFSSSGALFSLTEENED